MNLPGQRRAGAAALLAALILVAGSAWAPVRVEAATPSLTMVTATTYDILPDEHRVAVTVDITATSHLRDTVTRHFYTDRAYLAVLPTASNVHLSAASGKPSVKVSSRTATSAILLLRFGSQLGAGKSIKLTLTFDIVDPGGAPARTLRISPSLVSITAWALGTDGVAGSRVRVRFPAGYAATIGRGPLAGPTIEADGHVTYASEALATPTTFIADVVADRPGVLDNLRRSTSIGDQTVILLLRAWPDDPDWRARVFDLLSRGLPALGTSIGIDWRMGPQLEIRETIARSEGTVSGSAGGGSAAFDPSLARLDIPYTADPSAILHGAAHGWFNAGLVADRWVAEGFADLYAERAGTAIGVDVQSPAMTGDAVAHAGPLNGWVVGGPADDFGYAAALVVARSVANLAGNQAMEAVWRDAAGGIGAYQPIDPTSGGAPRVAEPGTGPLDWRTLLDLLEEHTGRSFEQLWRQWVVRPSDAALLDARSQARAQYDMTVAATAPWVLPRSIRDALRAWRFDDAMAQMQAAMAVLGQRDNVARAAASVDLHPPVAIRLAFEGTDGIPAAAAEALTELAVIDSFSTTLAARPDNPGLLTQIGLLGTHPEDAITAARDAFTTGDLDATVTHADVARRAWATAADVGGRRVISAATIAFALVALLWVVIRRPRRRSRSS